MSVIAIDPRRANVAVGASALLALDGDSSASSSWIEERDALLRFWASRHEGMAQGRVQCFLRRNSDLAWMLLDAEVALGLAFGSAIRLQFRMEDDPEAVGAPETLFGLVASTLPTADALDALNRFDASWFIQHAGAIGGRMAFDLKF